MAAVLNAANIANEHSHIIEIQAAESHFVLLSTTEDARALAVRLLPVQARFRVVHGRSSSAKESTSFLDQIERLVKLRRSGFLTDDEFSLAEVKLLGATDEP